MKLDSTSAEPLFFPLTLDTLAGLKDLKPSELRVYLYFRAKAPFDEMVQEVDFDELKAVTGITSFGTIYPALAQLHKRGLIHWRNVKSYVRTRTPNNVFNQTVEEQNGSIFRSYDRKIEKPIGKLKTQRRNRPQDKDFGSVKTNRPIDKQKERDISTDEEFLRWINTGLDALPHPPRGHHRAKQIERASNDPENQEKFLKLKSREKAIAMQSDPIPSFSTPQEKQREAELQRLETLQFWWDDGAHERVKATVAKHPEWGIVIGQFGPELRSP